MPAVTRSKQLHLEDLPSTTRPSKSQKRKAPSTPKATTAASSKSKKPRTTPQKSSSTGKTKSTSAQQPKSQNDTNTKSEEAQGKIYINRSPVLQLWAACVAQFVHPHLSWPSCISIGGAVSTICAVAKGRSIGAIGPSDKYKDKDKDKGSKKGKDGKDDSAPSELPIMQFHITVQAGEDGLALVGDKPKPGKEAPLVGKFGGEDKYRAVKETFVRCLESWQGSEGELNERAFGFYEEFRPSVVAGQSGWGRKGELDLDTVEEVVQRKP